jgi:TolA-binding protein
LAFWATAASRSPEILHFGKLSALALPRKATLRMATTSSDDRKTTQRPYQGSSDRRAPEVVEGPADLIRAADAARSSGRPAHAVAPLRKLTLRYKSDARAPVAAFTLGRVLVEDLGRASEAADAFERARRLAPNGPLAPEALARQIDALSRARQSERARQLALQYLSRYPDGRHAARLRALIAR